MIVTGARNIAGKASEQPDMYSKVKKVHDMLAAGLVKGGTGGKFKPKDNTVRRDAAILFARHVKHIGAVPCGGQ